MSWRNDDTVEGLPFGLPQDPKASPDGTSEKGAADESFSPGEKALIAMMGNVMEELRRTKEEVNSLKEEIRELKANQQKHDDYTRGIYSSDEEKITRITQVFMRWLDMRYKAEWEKELVKYVKEISDGKIIFRHRKLSKFVALLKRYMRESMRKKDNYKTLQEHICKNCMQTVGNTTKPIGDIHAIIIRTK